ncbi:MAG: hypothetical protein F2659_06805 [Actinobacteria bacterium]|uniref:Unannotated protein n=1 Tax=freshwater metagenome TaxID=449393 RepID=A0A6J6Q3H4_9ZZZZ|nr:hypothetical protein [Actinomycetota bacterium]
MSTSSRRPSRRVVIVGAVVLLCLLIAVAMGLGREASTPTVAINHGTGKNDLVVSIGLTGGFAPPGAVFSAVPTLVVSGDGRLITPGAQTAQFPGPLLAPLFERTITEAAIQKVLNFADAARLLQKPPVYVAELNVADAPNTVVVLSANGQTYTHSAYALGFDTPAQTPARQTLADFVAAISDVGKYFGAAHLGDETRFVAEQYRVQARKISAEEIAAIDPDPTTVAWPAAAGVTLASAGQCVVVQAADVQTLFAAAKQTTVFTDNGVAYQLAVAAMLPGDTCGTEELSAPTT